MIECNGGLPASGRIFLIGIGGVGMSGLAQLLVHLGYEVAGSDRGLAEPDRGWLFDRLRRQGIRLFGQDGSGPLAFRPQALVVSSAIEGGNPDLASASGVPVVHRAVALSQALSAVPGRLVTVAGSCGKTSVTGWLASALRTLGHHVLMVNGGYCVEAETEVLPGNFLADVVPGFKVVEVDESDKSLDAFEPDFGLLLNIGHDHYGVDELRAVFGRYLAKCHDGCVLPAELAPLAPSGLARRLFSSEADAPAEAAVVEEYDESRDGAVFAIRGFGQVRSGQCGLCAGWNAAAVLQMLRLLLPETPSAILCEALSPFRGIQQRFELMGTTADGSPVVNDYAHNPEKIAAALAAARARYGGPLLAAFQPHGFGPLGQMREELGHALADSLKPGDAFFILPVYYAGGTTSFRPTSEEVAGGYGADGLPVRFLAALPELSAMAAGRRFACVLVMGARDPSLRRKTRDLTQE